MSARSGLSTKGSGLLSEACNLYEWNVRLEQEKLRRNYMVVIGLSTFCEETVRQTGSPLAPNYVPYSGSIA